MDPDEKAAGMQPQLFVSLTGNRDQEGRITGRILKVVNTGSEPAKIRLLLPEGTPQPRVCHVTSLTAATPQPGSGSGTESGLPESVSLTESETSWEKLCIPPAAFQVITLQ